MRLCWARQLREVVLRWSHEEVTEMAARPPNVPPGFLPSNIAAPTASPALAMTVLNLPPSRRGE